MSRLVPAENEAADLSADLRIHDECRVFENAWAAVAREGGEPPKISFFVRAATGGERTALIKELILLDVDFGSRSRRAVDREGYLAELPGCEEVIDEALAEYQHSESAMDTAAVNSTADSGSQPVAAPAMLATTPQPAPADALRVGRYILLERLGVGGIGPCPPAICARKRSLAIVPNRTAGRPGTQ